MHQKKLGTASYKFQNLVRSDQLVHSGYCQAVGGRFMPFHGFGNLQRCSNPTFQGGRLRIYGIHGESQTAYPEVTDWSACSVNRLDVRPQDLSMTWDLTVQWPEPRVNGSNSLTGPLGGLRTTPCGSDFSMAVR